ncbi:hypothetical protein HZC34_05010 [Candidatus Saganbacteria bacterium]|nr:hypothetical protein [Candidatus Saganbacteria bacterium]
MAGKRIKFSFKPEKSCENVHLAGDFTDWQTNSILMKKNKTGEWTYTKSLTYGMHEYKFIADGEWQPGENSVIQVA